MSGSRKVTKKVPSHSCLFMHASPLTNCGFGHQLSVEMAAAAHARAAPDTRPHRDSACSFRAIATVVETRHTTADWAGARAGMRHCSSVICQMLPMPGLLANAFIHTWRYFWHFQKIRVRFVSKAKPRPIPDLLPLLPPPGQRKNKSTISLDPAWISSLPLPWPIRARS